jgi:TonB family protein
MKHILLVLPYFAMLAWAQDTSQIVTTSTFRTPCAYPAAALQAKAEGRTLVSYRGKPDGEIAGVTLLSSSGNKDLDAASVDCVTHWRLDPTSASSAFYMGLHRTYIAWSLGERPMGVYAGLPHDCKAYTPREAPAAKGPTRISFHIKVDGSVSEIDVVQSSGDERLDAAARACVAHWRYIPAVKDGLPVEVPWQADVAWK